MYGFIDKSGKEIIPIIYSCVFEKQENRFVANIGGEIDEKGFVSGGKFSYLDENGKEISKKYDEHLSNLACN